MRSVYYWVCQLSVLVIGCGLLYWIQNSVEHYWASMVFFALTCFWVCGAEYGIVRRHDQKVKARHDE